MNWVLVFSVATGILAIATAIAQSIREDQDNKARLNDKNEIIRLQTKNLDTLYRVNSLQNELIENSKSLKHANEEIIRLQNELYAGVVGDNGYCRFDFTFGNRKNFRGVLVNPNKYPVYNLRVAITDYEKLSKCKMKFENGFVIIDKDCYNNCTEIFDVTEISADQNSLLNYYITPEFISSCKLELHYKTRSNQYIEQVIYRTINNENLRKSRICVIQNNELIQIKEISRFPNEQMWNINWDDEFNLPARKSYLIFKDFDNI